MNTTIKILSAVAMLCLFLSCEQEQILPEKDSSEQISQITEARNGLKSAKQSAPKITGSVEVIWKGGSKGSDMGNKPENLLAFLEVDAHEGFKGKGPKGEIVFRVLETDLTLHRVIRANVIGVRVIPEEDKGFIVARVISDSKGCSGNGGSGHDAGCLSGSHDDSCGEADDPSSHDGGCSHETTDEGGCSHEDTGEPCPGGDSHEPSAGSGNSGGMNGNPLSGKYCRLGQIIALKVHDVATPGASGDGTTWKWFSPEAAPAIENIKNWPHLCKKEIIGGNMVVHY